MNDSKMAFSAMLISGFLFLAIGFVDYYPLVVYHNQASFETDHLYRFLIKFEPIKLKYTNKFLLVMAIIASVMLYNPKKVEGKTYSKGLTYFILGIGLLAFSDTMKIGNLNLYWMSSLAYFLGFLFTLSGTNNLFQVLSFDNLAKKDPFNDINESFLQMEEKIDTKHSVNIPFEYKYKGKLRNGWINIVKIIRDIILIGKKGSGKSFELIEVRIEQIIN